MKAYKKTKMFASLALALVMVFSFAATAFAASFDWSSGFDVNKRTSYNGYDTWAIQMSLYNYCDSQIDTYLGTIAGYPYPYTYTHTGYDGSFGYGTEDAVQRFQSLEGLTSDGIVGNQTWSNLRDIFDCGMWDDGVFTMYNDEFMQFVECDGNLVYGADVDWFKYENSHWYVYSPFQAYAMFEY